MAGAWPDYHEYTLFDWNHILAEGPHAATLLGENDDVACATLSALFTFMLPWKCGLYTGDTSSSRLLFDRA